MHPAPEAFKVRVNAAFGITDGELTVNSRYAVSSHEEIAPVERGRFGALRLEQWQRRPGPQRISAEEMIMPDV